MSCHAHGIRTKQNTRQKKNPTKKKKYLEELQFVSFGVFGAVVCKVIVTCDF